MGRTWEAGRLGPSPYSVVLFLSLSGVAVCGSYLNFSDDVPVVCGCVWVVPECLATMAAQVLGLTGPLLTGASAAASLAPDDCHNTQQHTSDTTRQQGSGGIQGTDELRTACQAVGRQLVPSPCDSTLIRGHVLVRGSRM